MPLELVDVVPFLVVSGYLLAGLREPADSYLADCLKECPWRAEAYKPKTAEEKRAALAKLVAIPMWKKRLSAEKKKVLAAQIE